MILRSDDRKRFSPTRQIQAIVQNFEIRPKRSGTNLEPVPRLDGSTVGVLDLAVSSGPFRCLAKLFASKDRHIGPQPASLARIANSGQARREE